MRNYFLPVCIKRYIVCVVLLLSLNLFSTYAIDDPKYPFHPQQSLEFSSSGLPIVVIELDERMVDKNANERVSATMKIIWKEGRTINYLSQKDNFDYDGKIAIKYRGTTSFYNSEKKPFSIRLRNQEGKKVKASILGMSEDDDWALLAPYNDKSLIRDVLLFELMKGSMEYIPSGRFCEVVLNGVYQGIYIMAERARRGSGRININGPVSDEGDGLTGGYHLEIDRNNSPGFRGEISTKDLIQNDLNICNYYQYKYPDEDDLTNTQKQYIQNYVKEMERTVAGRNFKDPENGFRAYLDTVSLMNYYIAQELTKNIDGYRLSTPIYKYADSVDKRFKFSLWDFNVSFGNADYCSGWSTQGWAINTNRFFAYEPVPWMFKRILQDKVFYSSLKEQWRELRKTRLSENNISHVIDSLYNLLQEPQIRNFKIWNKFDSYVWPNYYIASSWEGEMDYLEKWIYQRVEWIDSQWIEENTNYIPNGNFEAAASRRDNMQNAVLSEWDISGNVILTTSDVYEDEYALLIHNNSSASQIITELFSGKYMLSFWSKTQFEPGAYLSLCYQTDKSGNDEIRKEIKNGDAYQRIEIEDIIIYNNFMKLNFNTQDKYNNACLWIDDVRLIRQEDLPSDINNEGIEENILLKTDRSVLALSIFIRNIHAYGVPIEVYSVSGQKLYMETTYSNDVVLRNIFSKNNIYIIRVGEVVKKIAF